MSSTSSKKRRGSDIPSGDDHSRNQGEALERYSRKWANAVGTEFHIRSISIYPPEARREHRWLIVGHAWGGGYRYVAFQQGDDMLGALLGFLTRAWQQKLVWKIDTYAEKTLAP